VGSKICERGVEAGFEVLSVSRRGAPQELPPGRLWRSLQFARHVSIHILDPRFLS
jgi:hypothetical protein